MKPKPGTTERCSANVHSSVGMVYDVQRCCVHDGPGIRTTVFLKGCPLDCRWCHNPESKGFEKQLSYTPSSCISCGSCVEICPAGAHTLENGIHLFDPGKCARDLWCPAECASLALEVVGREVTAGEIMKEVERDKPFYDTSGGGMTLSGGEPMAQFDFAVSLLDMAKAWGIHTCVETCGFSSSERFRRIVPLVDLFLWDIKDSDSGRHDRNTGVRLDRILGNLKIVDGYGGKTILRCVLIPEINLSEKHLSKVASLYKGLDNCQGVTLLPYHLLGTSKHERLGDFSEKEQFSEPSPEDIEQAYEFLKNNGVQCIHS